MVYSESQTGQPTIGLEAQTGPFVIDEPGEGEGGRPHLRPQPAVAWSHTPDGNCHVEGYAAKPDYCDVGIEGLPLVPMRSLVEQS